MIFLVHSCVYFIGPHLLLDLPLPCPSSYLPPSSLHLFLRVYPGSTTGTRVVANKTRTHKVSGPNRQPQPAISRYAHCHTLLLFLPSLSLSFLLFSSSFPFPLPFLPLFISLIQRPWPTCSHACKNFCTKAHDYILHVRSHCRYLLLTITSQRSTPTSLKSFLTLHTTLRQTTKTFPLHIETVLNYFLSSPQTIPTFLKPSPVLHTTRLQMVFSPRTRATP